MGTVKRGTQAFGIDIGGTGIKGAVVDTTKGVLVTERTRILTPQPSTPEAVAKVVAQLVSGAGWTGEIGATFPAVIKHGVAQSAANVDPAWLGTDVDKTFTEAVGAGSEVIVLNDADAAGIAEARFGAAKGVDGVVIMLTFGTGIGSALLMNGVLVPNTGTCSSTGTTRRHEPRPRCATSTTCPTSGGPSGSTTTCSTSSGCSARTCSSSAAG
jgi:polyphosphate glucokinase